MSKVRRLLFSVRGTKTSIVKDLIADAEILMGGETRTKRFTGEYDKMDKIIAKYPGKKDKNSWSFTWSKYKVINLEEITI